MSTLQLSKYKDIYIISPHFDDAALSCGGLLSKLDSKANITVINIFSKAHKGPYTLSAKKFLRVSGNFKDATSLFSARQREDKEALSAVKIKIVNLGLQDSLFRRKSKVSVLGKIFPEIDHNYPTYRWHVLKSSGKNDAAVEELKKKLTRFSKKGTIALVPYGIGNHVDHRIARGVCEELFTNLILYSDFPYNIRTKNYGKAPKNYIKKELSVNLMEKEELLKKYKTQFNGLFSGQKMPAHKEVFFVRGQK